MRGVLYSPVVPTAVCARSSPFAGQPSALAAPWSTAGLAPKRLTPGSLAASASATATGERSLKYTQYEGNTFTLSFPNGVRALVDPWLVGDLSFFGTGLLYTGRKKKGDPGMEVAEGVDAIFLTQYLEDHTHLPTLNRLDKTIPVIACPQAAEIAKSLGFTNVVPLAPGGSTKVCGARLSVRATEGGLVGPPWSQRQNGFVLQENVQDGVSVYFEPHVDYGSASVKREAPVDVIISPIEEIYLAPASRLPGFAIVKGGKAPVELTRTLQPRVVVPMMNGDIGEEGLVTPGVHRDGKTPAKFAESLRAAGVLNVAVVEPPAPGVELDIPLPLDGRSA